MARMHELAITFIYPLNGYFTIDSVPIYNIQDHPAFHFAFVNAKQLFLAP